MSLIKFLLFRNKKTSVLAARKYGEKERVEPENVSVLANRKYGKSINQDIDKEEEQTLQK